MFLAQVDKSRRLLKITIADHVEPGDARECLESLQWLLAEMQSGFRLLTDLSGIKSMSTSTAPYIGQIMELCTQKGLDSVIRVLPAEARNDIGFAIMSQFHYGPHVRIVTCDSLEEASSHLSDYDVATSVPSK
jgi:anti-anti-sigma regulatory factor